MTEHALTRLLFALAWGFLIVAVSNALPAIVFDDHRWATPWAGTVGTALGLAGAAHGWLRDRAARRLKETS
jgi:hypothetical protein